MRDHEGDLEKGKGAAAASAIGGTTASPRPRPPSPTPPPPPPSSASATATAAAASSFLPPLNLRAAALRSQEGSGGCFCGISARPNAWEQSSPEEVAWAAEVSAATAHLPPPSRLLPRETTAALVARAVEGGEESGEAAALRRLKERFDAAGLPLPTVSISWKGLSVDRRRRRGRGRRRRGKPEYPSLVSPFFSVADAVTSAVKPFFFFDRRLREGSEEETEEERKRTWRRVLRDSTGVLLPGTTTLLLGPPGSGKTTLLRALSGRLKPGGGVRIVNADKVLFNGVRGDGGSGLGRSPSSPSPFSFSLPRTVAYVSAADSHFPTLTVRETLRFAEECHGGDPTIRPLLERLVTIEGRQSASGSVVAGGGGAGGTGSSVGGGGGGPSSPSVPSSRKPVKDEALDRLLAALCNPANSAATEWILRVLRLSGCADTPVGGDALHRGVSGGERRRVSSAELLVGAARALCLDEVSTGLDSASTVALARSLRGSARDLGVAVLAALLAPEPDAVAEFDDVIVLAEGGRTLYHGPVEGAFAHFASLGLFPLEQEPSGKKQQDVADFLLDVASPEGRRALWEEGLRRRERKEKENLSPPSLTPLSPPPPSTAALAEAFRASELGQRLALAASRPFPRTPETDAWLCPGSFAAPRFDLFKALLRRAAKVDLSTDGDGASAAATRWLLALLMSLCVGSLFYNLPVSLDGARARLGVLFFALFFVVTLAVPAIEVAHARKGVALRQRDDGFYPAWLDVASQAATAVPVVAVDAVAATLPLYFLSGFSRDPGRVLSFVGVFFLLELAIDALNRALGVLSTKLNVGIAVGVCVLLALETTAGFTLSARSIPPFWRFLFHYVNPMAWAFRSLAVSEFGDPRWDKEVEGSGSSSAADPLSSDRLGDAALALFEIQKSPALAWGGAAFLLGFYLAMIALGAVGLSAMRAPEPPGGSSAASSAAEEEEREGRGAEADGDAVSVAVAVAPPPTPNPLLPPPPRLSLAVIDLSYFVPGKNRRDGERRLLDRVTASFEPGTLTALMGPSGAGKTTLLDVLAFRKTSGRVSFGNTAADGGGIFVGGAAAEPSSFSAVSGYVEQSVESHAPLLSVRESVVFSARLRLPAVANSSRAAAARAARAAAEEALAVVGLAGGGSSSDLLVHSLPLEARKRLAIAVELAARPSVLFLDEPTSGLDGRAAAAVARAMRAAADAGRTVVSTIHQPSSEVFALFDELLLLAPGGRVAFAGPLGGRGAPLLVEHFASVLPKSEKGSGGERPGPGENVAAWAMEALSVLEEEEGEEDEEEREGAPPPPIRPRPRKPPSRSSAAAAAFPRSPAAAAALAAARRASEDGRGSGATPPPRAGCLAHFAAHFLRGWRSYARDPARNTSRFLVTAVIALIISTIEAGKGRADRVTSLRELGNALGLLYLSAVVLSMDVAFEAQPFVSAERLVYYRERAAGAARAGPQLLASAAVELPYLFAQTLLFCVPVYLSVGYEKSFQKFGFFFLVLSLVNAAMWMLAAALVQLTSAVFVASLCLSVACSLFSLLAGFMLPAPLMPPWWRWAFYANPVSYAIAAIATSQYGDRGDVVIEDAPEGSPRELGALLSSSYGFGGRGVFPSQWEAVAVLCGFCALFAAAAYAGLKMNWQKR